MQSLRAAIPASLDDSAGVSKAYEQREAELVAKANGEPPAARGRRATPSKNQTNKPARRAPQPKQK